MVSKELLKSISEREDSFSGAFGRLFRLIEILRSPEGCPWDSSQTPASMRPCLIEEMFEVVDAITKDDIDNTREELGDLMFNILLTAYMYEQKGDFTISDSLNDVVDKLIRRHPHVFTDQNYVNGLWEKIKTEVEGRKKDSVLDEVPEGFPPLMKSYKYLKKAAKKGFDWTDVKDVNNKILEELNEVEDAALKTDRSHLEEELGDLLLSVVNLSRFYGIDPSVALSRANDKFYNRFSFVEKSMKTNDIPMTTEHLQEMERFWQQAKQVNSPNKSGH